MNRGRWAGGDKNERLGSLCRLLRVPGPSPPESQGTPLAPATLTDESRVGILHTCAHLRTQRLSRQVGPARPGTQTLVTLQGLRQDGQEHPCVW